MGVTSATIYAMREVSGLSLSQCKQAAMHADQRLGGDYLLALIHADIALRSGSRSAPDLMEQARERRSVFALLPGWSDIAALSNNHEG